MYKCLTFKHKASNLIGWKYKLNNEVCFYLYGVEYGEIRTEDNFKVRNWQTN